MVGVGWGRSSCLPRCQRPPINQAPKLDLPVSHPVSLDEAFLLENLCLDLAPLPCSLLAFINHCRLRTVLTPLPSSLIACDNHGVDGILVRSCECRGLLRPKPAVKDEEFVLGFLAIEAERLGLKLATPPPAPSSTAQGMLAGPTTTPSRRTPR